MNQQTTYKTLKQVQAGESVRVVSLRKREAACIVVE